MTKNLCVLKRIVESNYFYSLTLLGYASNYPRKTEMSVILYDREDSMDQHCIGHAESRRLVIQRILAKNGFRVIACFCDIEKGDAASLSGRTEFFKALELAKILDVPIVVPSVDRIMCPVERNELEPNAPLLEDDMSYLKPLVKDVLIITVIPPDTQFTDVCDVFSIWYRKGMAMLRKAK